LNKTDLVTEAELPAIEERLKKINPTVQIFRTQKSKLDPKQLIGIKAFNLDRVLEMDAEFLKTDGEHAHDPSVASCSTKFEEPLDLNLMRCWIRLMLNKFGADLYRYKGVLNVDGADAKYVFQGVGMIFDGEFRGIWGETEKRESRFVFIGKNLDHAGLLDGFHKCKIGTALRFKRGSMVLASAEEGWEPGTIYKTWDGGYPYSIQLKKRQKGLMWCPFDVDEFVKEAKTDKEWVFKAHPFEQEDQKK